MEGLYFSPWGKGTRIATAPGHFGYPGSPFPEYAVWPRHSPVCSVRCRVSSPGPGDGGVALIHWALPAPPWGKCLLGDPWGDSFQTRVVRDDAPSSWRIERPFGTWYVMSCHITSCHVCMYCYVHCCDYVHYVCYVFMIICIWYSLTYMLLYKQKYIPTCLFAGDTPPTSISPAGLRCLGGPWLGCGEYP